ncbi:MAG: family 16 glycoside hydrolase, partial [Draconibacterium sp.]|nr:family 16 glycoside hydrolase [Draconibacterium sp.]
MKNTILLVIIVLFFSCQTQQPKTQQLFNGVDLTGWYPDVPAADVNPDTTKSFIVRDSLLVSLGTPGGHLITDSVYSNYRLEVEYRFAAKPGN